MNFSGHLRMLTLATIFLVAGQISLGQTPTQSSVPSGNSTTTVRLHWGARAGVSRYRLQVARDLGFSDIVFDHVVAGTEQQINDLAPGRYFWRIAALTKSLGEFSSAGTVDVSADARLDRPVKNDAVAVKPAAPKSIVTGGGWRAAVGEISYPALGNLRSQDRFDIVGVNSQGIVFALDSASGVALWSARLQSSSSSKSPTGRIIPLLFKTRSGLDNVIVLFGTSVTAFEGASGRQLWRVELPAAASAATIIGEASAAKIVCVDNTQPRLFLLDGDNGSLLAQVRLSDRVIGAPVPFLEQGARRFLVALAHGTLEVRDETGTIVRSTDAGSPATTAPLFVGSAQGPLVVLGTRAGLTAFNAKDLTALGRVELKDDAPRGVLAAEDLNADGVLEVVMITERGRVISLNAADGKILWDAAIATEAETVTFADVNADGALDLLIATGQTLAIALSGRDGSVIWKDSEAVGAVANHSSASIPRASVAVPFGKGVLFVAADPSHAGLRAIEFPRGTVRSPNR
jgi:outer membrane protein assembly factor BamB